MKLKKVLNFSLLAALFMVAVPQVTYGMGMQADESVEECGVCYEEASDSKRLISMPCCQYKQSICFDCLNSWIGFQHKEQFNIDLDSGLTYSVETTGQPRYTCPMCRKDIREFGDQFPLYTIFYLGLKKPFWVYQLYGTAATAALGTISYYILNSLQSYQFNSLENSVNSITNILISAEPNFNFDLYNSPFELLGLQVQYDLDSIVHSVSSNELKITLENAIKNFDKSFDVVWYALDEGGYYAKGKSAFMRDKKQQVENLRAAAQVLKEALAECRAQVSVWKKVLGVTAAGALGIGAWVYAQR